MKIACLTPLPPTRSGIAHYASLLLPHLGQHGEVTAVVSDDDVDAALASFAEPRGFSIVGLSTYRTQRDAFDVAIYQLGNNPHHEHIYDEALAHRGVAVLHDLVLHHLIVEMTLARDDVEGYVDAMRANHGEVGVAWARGRAGGMHDEVANFLMPASLQLANRSAAVIVHNRYAVARLHDLGVRSPVVIVPHPHDSSARPSPRVREETRALLGFAATTRVIGMFGFLTSAKRAEVVLSAFAAAFARDANLRLLVVGEPAPNIDVDQLMRERAVPREAVTFTGYANDADFSRYTAAIDRMINLRYPTAGEASGTLVQAFEAGKPVAVSGYAQFAEFPAETVTRIPLGIGEEEALIAFMLGELDERPIAAAQHAWLATNASTERTVDGYLEAIRLALQKLPERELLATPRTLPLLTLLQLLDVRSSLLGDGRTSITLHVRNDGDAVLRTRSYGSPGYRLLLKLFDGEREIANRWLEPSGDVGPGAIAEFEAVLRLPSRPLTLKLFNAAEGIPLLEGAPWATKELDLATV